MTENYFRGYPQIVADQKKGEFMTMVEPIRCIESIKELERYFAENSPRDLLLFTIGTNCGLRISDIVALNVGDVRNKSHIQIIEKKTGKFKKFPINAKLRPMIENFTRGKQSEEALFVSIFQNRLDRFGAYYIIKAACQTVGIQEKVGTHTLRKTFGYHHYKKFKDVAILQKIFNHSNPSITLRYIGIEQDQIDESYNNFIL